MKREKTELGLSTSLSQLLVTGVARCGGAILTMAGQAIAHVQIAELIDAIHRFHGTMTFGAVESFGDVRLVGEICVFGDFVDADPLDRLALRMRLCQLDDIRLVDSNHAVAVHADIQRWHGGVRGTLHVRMAIDARNVVVARVKLMAERNGLLGSIAFVAPDIHPGDSPDNKYRHDKNEKAQLRTHAGTS